MSKTTSYPPSFLPQREIGAKAKYLELIGNGERRGAFNIIPTGEVPRRTRDFCDIVLNPIVRGTDATIVPILNGALFFAADLIREIDGASHVELMSVTARSYGRNRKSEEVFVSRDSIIPEKVKDRTLVIVDDILDTGKTMAAVVKCVEEHKPKQIITVFMVRKMLKSQPLVRPDYWLFEVHGESWVFGYGMDLDEKYRHLQFICDARLDLYHKDGTPRY